MKKIEGDFDILNIIKKIESIAVASFVSISFPQKQIALRLSQRVLSDNNSSNEESENSVQKDDFKLSNRFDYLKYFLKLKSPEDIRLLKQYIWYMEHSKHFVT